MSDKYDILPISVGETPTSPIPKNGVHKGPAPYYDILPLEHPKLTRTKKYFYKPQQIILNVENKITHKNKKIIFTKKKSNKIKPIDIDDGCNNLLFFPS